MGPTTAIAQVQGTTGVSPLTGESVEVRGVVTLAEPGIGFYVQSEVPDADPQTSEGLFVRAERAQVLVGERVSLRGRVQEQAGSTELHAVELIQACGRVVLEPASVRMEGTAALERWEHMWVSARAPWTLIDAARRGRNELVVARGGRAYAAGHVLGASEEDRASEVWRLRFSGSTPAPPRLGSSTEALMGIVQLGTGGPGLLADRAPSWRERDAPAPAAPAPDVLRVAAMNLHNYFAEVGGRGAASEAELERQRTKLVAALSALSADVLALVEVGNSASSVEHLAAGLNEQRANGARFVWSAVEPPGASPLRSVLLYRADRVQAAGEAWFELGVVFTRPPLFQRFQRGQVELTLGVVHLKSKRCAGELPQSELEGCGAEVRAAEAAELSAAAERAGSARLLLLGDFNADTRETPLVALQERGWVDLLDAVPAADRYSYVFDGRATLLDHALSSSALAPAAVSASIWHINADEPVTRGYSLANPPSEYAPDARRSSDHDPISVDLRL